MAKILIKSAEQYILSDDDYKWLQENYNKPLDVMYLSFEFESGFIWCISIYRPREDKDNTCITLFVNSNKLEYEFEGGASHAYH